MAALETLTLTLLLLGYCRTLTNYSVLRQVVVVINNTRTYDHTSLDVPATNKSKRHQPKLD